MNSNFPTQNGKTFNIGPLSVRFYFMSIRSVPLSPDKDKGLTASGPITMSNMVTHSQPDKKKYQQTDRPFDCHHPSQVCLFDPRNRSDP